MSQMYCIEMSGDTLNDPKAKAALATFLSDCAEANAVAGQELARELGVSEACACDIQYLRTRSRWTEELEDELIELHRNGEAPNIFEFGTKSHAY